MTGKLKFDFTLKSYTYTYDVTINTLSYLRRLPLVHCVAWSLSKQNYALIVIASSHLFLRIHYSSGDGKTSTSPRFYCGASLTQSTLDVYLVSTGVLMRLALHCFAFRTCTCCVRLHLLFGLGGLKRQNIVEDEVSSIF